MAVTTIREFVVMLENRPGELGRLAQKLASNGVNIEEAYHVFVAGDEARIGFRVDRVSAAVKALR